MADTITQGSGQTPSYTAPIELSTLRPGNNEVSRAEIHWGIKSIDPNGPVPLELGDRIILEFIGTWHVTKRANGDGGTILQCHGPTSTGWIEAPWQLTISNDQLKFHSLDWSRGTMWEAVLGSFTNDTSYRIKCDITLGATDASGLSKVWVNGVQVLNSSRANFYADMIYPANIRTGLYSNATGEVQTGRYEILYLQVVKAMPTQTLFNAEVQNVSLYHSLGVANSYGDIPFGAFPMVVPNTMEYGIDCGYTDDPRSDVTRQVIWTSSVSAKNWSTPWPRAELRTPFLIKPAYRGNTIDEYWESCSFYYPSTRKNPDNSLVSNKLADLKWNSLFTPAWGPPYTGSSPMGLQAFARGGIQTFRINDQFNVIDEASATWPYDTWVQMVVHFKFAYQAKGGFYDMWINAGPGSNNWRRVTFNGGAKRLWWDTLKSGCNDAWTTGASNTPNHSGIGCYGEDMAIVYWGGHKIGTGIASSVALDDYGLWSGQLPWQ